MNSNRRKFIRSSALITGGTLVLPTILSNCTSGADMESADFIFQGGNILTMDPGNSRAEAMAVRGGRIISVGSQDQIKVYQGKTTQLVDLDGRTLMPGMIDPHTHTWSANRSRFIR